MLNQLYAGLFRLNLSFNRREVVPPGRARYLAGLGVLLAACLSCQDTKKTNSQATPSTTIAAVTVAPTSPTLTTGQTQQFTAAVTGTGSYTSAVAWTASAGSITSAGLFTAPGNAGTCIVTATSVQDGSKSGQATATVSVQSSIASVIVSPANATVTTGQSEQFTAAVTGTGSYSSAVTWTASGGSITSGGLFTAPGNAGTYTVMATSTQDGSKVGQVTVTVTVQIVDLTIPMVYITQATQTPSFNVPLVKDRDGFLRAFVVANQVNSAMPQVRVRIYNANSTLVQTFLIVAPSSSVPLTANESSLNNSWNVAIPNYLLQPNYKLLVDVDPTGSILESDKSNNSWPSSGTPYVLDIRTLPKFQVTFWKVQTGDLQIGRISSSVDLDRTDLYDPTTNAWSSATSLGTARGAHSATILGNGKVLVAGGALNGVSVAGAKLFDPNINIWSNAGNLITPRRGHTATLLGNGKVLVVGGAWTGGVGSNVCVANAELYDPATNSWTSAGSLVTARTDATATLLVGGKVLVTGGNNGLGTAIATAELYDPATNAWSSVAALQTARCSHLATLLGNGKILVAGGWGNNASYPTNAEIYNPTTNIWSSGGNMVGGRDRFALTLLENGKVLVVGGWNGSSVLYSAELYDPSINAWSSAGKLNKARYVFRSTLLNNGKVLVSGGMADGGNSTLTSSELYDPAQNAWVNTGSLTVSRLAHTATLLGNGRVLVTGGNSTTEPGTIGGFTAMLEKIWPVNINLDWQLGGIWTTSAGSLSPDGTGWGSCVDELQAKHIADGSVATLRYYYGVVNPNLDYGIGVKHVIGIGQLGKPTALGWDRFFSFDPEPSAETVFAHELGHNFNLMHVACDGEAGTDPNYPIPGGNIDVLGTDVTGPTLKNPLQFKDVMSYCGPKWVSAYNYRMVLSNREFGHVPIAPPPFIKDPSTPRSLLLWGHVSNGLPTLEPSFHMAVDPQPPEPGDQLIEGFDTNGRKLFSTSFALTQTGCMPIGSHESFCFSIPIAPSDTANLKEIRWTKSSEVMALQGGNPSARALPLAPDQEPSLQSMSDGRTRLIWDHRTHPLVMVRDKATGNVLAFGRNGDMRFSAEAEQLEIHFSDGVSSRIQTIERPIFGK